MNIGSIERNDLRAVKRFYESRNREITSEEWEMLAMLQDDPEAFIKLSERWNVRASIDAEGAGLP